MSEQESMDHLLRQLMAGNPAPAVSSAFDQRLARRLRPSRLGPVGRMVMSLYTLLALAVSVWEMRSQSIGWSLIVVLIGVPLMFVAAARLGQRHGRRGSAIRHTAE